MRSFITEPTLMAHSIVNDHPKLLNLHGPQQLIRSIFQLVGPFDKIVV